MSRSLFVFGFLVLIYGSTSWAQAVIREGREWLQPVDFLGHTFNEVSTVCPGGVCNGSLPGSEVDLTGYTWASVADINQLFNSYGVYPPLGSEPAEAFNLESPGSTVVCGFSVGQTILSEFMPTYEIEAYSFVAGFTRDYGAGFQKGAIGGAGVDRTPNGYGQFIDTLATSSVNTLDPAFGHWFWRPVVTTPTMGGSLSQDLDTVTCSGFDGTLTASADLPNAELKLFASALDFSDYQGGSTADLIDLITITEGWDANGIVTGNVLLNVDGAFDTGDFGNESDVTALAIIWYPDQKKPSCFDDAQKCGLLGASYSYAQVKFQLGNGQIVPSKLEGALASVTIESAIGSDLRATLSVPWEVSKDEPTFFVSLHGFTTVAPGKLGAADFSNTFKGAVTSTTPVKYTYSSKKGFASNGENAQPSDSPVDLTGRVKLGDGTDLCAMVLASGQYMFACGPDGPYALRDLPREKDGSIRRQVYVDGTFPSVESMKGTVSESVIMKEAFECKSYNSPYEPGEFPDSMGKRVSIFGRVLVQDTEEPICAMVLSNGAFMFSCDENNPGGYALEFPLSAQGQYEVQVYADGFAPVVQKFDEFGTPGDIRMARASECESKTQ